MITSPETDHYTKNLALLKAHHPHVLQYMENYPPEPLGRVEIALDGRVNIWVQHENSRKINLCDPEESRMQLNHYLEVVPEDFFGFVGFLGMGSGYEIIELMQKRPHIQKIAVFDLHPGIFHHVLHHTDLSGFLSDFRLILSLGPVQDVNMILKPAIDVLMLETIHVFSHQPSFSLDKKNYADLKEKVFECANYYNVEGGTKIRRGELFFKNQMTHLQFLHHDYLLEDLYHAFKDKPAILVSGGPSLNRNVHLLEHVKHKAVIFAVDSVLPLLLHHNITPDFISSIDALDLTYEKIAGFSSMMKDVNLICKTGVNLKTPNLSMAGKIFWAFSDNVTDDFICNVTGGEKKIEGAGTVAHLNLMAANLMGCAPIIFIGQDLAFTGNESHARGLLLGGHDRMAHEMLDKDAILKIKGVNGTDVITNRAYLNMKQHFELIIRNNPGTYINATFDGGAIDGTEAMPMERAIEGWLKKDIDKKQTLSNVSYKRVDSGSILHKLQPVQKEATALLTLVESTEKLTLAITKSFHRSFRKNKKPRSFSDLPNDIKKQIVKVQNDHDEIKRQAHIWELLKDITINGLKETERKSHRLKLFQKNPHRFGEWVRGFLEYLLFINQVQKDALSTFIMHLSNALSVVEEERHLLGEIETQGERHDTLMALARLYFNAGKFALSKPVIERLIKGNKNNGHAYFYNGCIEALLSNFDGAKRMFKQALDLDVGIMSEIDAFRERMGNEYLAFADYFRDVDTDTAIRMYKKGMMLAPDHEALKKGLNKVEKKAPANLPGKEPTQSKIKVRDNYYHQNIGLLEKNHPHVWQAIKENRLSVCGELLPCEDDHLKLIMKNDKGEKIVFHDNIQAETEKFYETLKADATGFVALLGMGLGYSAIKILKERPQIRKLALFELSPEIFHTALQTVDLYPLLSDPRVILSVGPHPDVPKLLEPIIPLLRVENTYTLNSIPSFQTNMTGYSQLFESVFKFANEFNVGGATTLALGEKFTRNRFSNFGLIHNDYLLEHLENTFKGIPAFIVAGGPSLDKNIHYLQKAKNRSVIICVDTVLPVLTANGISPDFLASIDSQDLTFEKISHMVSAVKDIFLITMPWVNQKFPRVFPARERFWSFSGHFIDQWMNGFLGGKPFARGAGTVAHMNMIAALVMGCSPIVFVGQDLAYTNRACHAAHTVLTEKKRMDGILKDNFMLPGINGGTVISSRSFHTMKIYFEELIQRNPDRRFINATEGGAHIEGTAAQPLAQVIDTFCKHPVDVIRTVNENIRHRKKADLIHLQKGVAPVISSCRTLIKEIEEMDAMIHGVGHDILKFHRSGARIASANDFPEPIRVTLSQIDTIQQKLDQSSDIWRLVEDLTLNGLKQSERMLHEISMMAVTHDPSRYMDWLLSSVDRISYINSVRLNALGQLEKMSYSLLSGYQEEILILNAIKKQGETKALLLDRALSLFDRKDYVKALPLLERVAELMPDIAEVQFSLGCIYALKSDHGAADICFKRAQTTDQSYGKRAREFYHTMADAYWEYASFFKDVDDHSFRLMLARGLMLENDHPILKKELEQHIHSEYERIKSMLEKGQIQEIGHDIRVWYKDITENEFLQSVLNHGEKGDFFCFYGNLLVSEGHLAEALTCFKDIASIFPDNPRFYLFLADVHFALNQFDEGVASLTRAVSIDRSYARCWDNMGDNLRKQGQIEDAISAYELCYKSLPEHRVVLQKIGDCYMELGKIEAAEEAYRQYQLKNEKGFGR